MLFPESQVRIWLYNRPCDMRKPCDALSALIKAHLLENPFSGELFVFINRKRTQIKILYIDRSGYCIRAKRLEQGRFQAHAGPDDKKRLEWTDLKLILEGIYVHSVRRFKRYTPT